MIYFLCPDKPEPSGGVKQIYRQASILRSAGIEACVLHRATGFVCTWFEHDAAIAYLGQRAQTKLRHALGPWGRFVGGKPVLSLVPGQRVTGGAGLPNGSWALTSRDVVVVPEYHGARLGKAVVDLPLVVFNQNAFGTFRGWGFADQQNNVYHQPNLLGIVCVSEHNLKYLTYAFPHAKVVRTVNGVDLAVFRHSEQAPRGKQLALMPRKMAGHLEQVVQLLRLRGTLRGWTLAPIDGFSEQQVAQVLRESAIFLSSSSDEGFGLPPLEAALAGCLIVGYTGSAAQEYFYEDLTWPVPQGDVLQFAKTVERVIALWESQPDEVASIRAKLAEKLAKTYSLQAERESVLAAWREIAPGSV